MDKNEVITLSSDDDTDTTNQIEESNTTKTVKPNCKKSSKLLKNPGVIVKNNQDKDSCFKKEKSDTHSETASNGSPEVVELVDFLDKLDEDLSSESEQNSELDVIDLDETTNKNECKHERKTEAIKKKMLCSNTSKINREKITDDFSIRDQHNNSNEANEEFNENLKFFTEFVEYCGSLEKIQNDRIKLTRKLMKRYGEADSNYIKSQEFKYLIEKYRDKINKSNLYLIAKEITEELSFKKKIAVGANKSNIENENSQRDVVNESSKEILDTSKLTKKRAKFVNRIVKKLDKLGSKIQELEEQEVCLSDEEDSTYILLQRYRERFCQIYKRLCAYTNQIPDPNNRKICFTESKYPAINKCIETWLNKTKRFPDFTDIMKLLESQSSSLSLPSNKELVRAIAVEIFQKVGVMLQRRRIYDLWDIFCGFLDDGKDPADDDSDLNETLKNNFETRLKKEQEIFQHFAELQEKEKLEPEEVADEEANHSPVESENDDDKEIEEIENCLNKRMDDAIKSGEDPENKECEGNENNSENEGDPTSPKAENTMKSKETKNNYKNCKSLKWRQESSGKSKSDTSVSEDSSTGAENEKEKSENGIKVTDESSEFKVKKSGDVGKDDSDLELIAVEENNENNEIKTGLTCGATCKRASTMKIENLTPKKKKHVEPDDFDVFEIDEENEKNEVFGVHYCQVFPDNVFQDLNEEKKDWKKRRVFRDLTNVNKLMELHGKRKKMSGLFSPSFFHRSFCQFEKSSWKKRFKVSFRWVGSKDEKCALNQEEKSRKTITSDSGGDSDEKEIRNNSERGGGGGHGEGNNLFSSHGNGSEEDNNEDENKKSRRTGDEINDNQHEEEKEEDEEEENDNENGDCINNGKILKEFVSIQETEKPSDFCHDNKTLLEFEKSSYECKEEAIKPCNLKLENRVEVEKELRVEENEDGGDQMMTNSVIEEAVNEEVKIVMEQTQNKCRINNRIFVKKRDGEVPRKSIKLEGLNNYVENLKTENQNPETIPSKILEIQPSIFQPLQLDIATKTSRRSTTSPSDEERVKRFLMHSPSSISITPPKKPTPPKTPSQAILQALATLRNLKDISATIVPGKPRSEDEVVVIEGSVKRRSNEDLIPAKRRKNDLPVISNVQSIATNPAFTGFDEPFSGNEEQECDSSSIRISNVWGNSLNTFMEIPIESVDSEESFPQSKPSEKKNTKKTVEYVVLE